MINSSVRKLIGGVIVGSSVLSLVVLGLTVSRINKANKVTPGNTSAAIGVCSDTIAQVPLSVCNEGCFVNADCSQGLVCIGATGTTTAGKCRNSSTPDSTTCNAGVGDIINRVITPYGSSGTFSFTYNYPAGSTVMEAPRSPFTITTSANGANDGRLGNYYTGNGGSGWFTAGTVVTTTVAQPASGWCLRDVGTYVNDRVSWRGSACRNVTRTVRADDATAAIFKFEQCSTSNWTSTACTYDVPTGVVTPLSVLSLTVANTGTTEARFGLTVTGDNAQNTPLTDNSMESGVLGVVSKTVSDVNGNTTFIVPAGRTVSYQLDTFVKKITALNVNVETGSITVSRASMFDLATGETKVNDANTKQFTVNTVKGSSTGLRGQYFDNRDFTNLKLTQTDQTVNADWVYASPASQIGADTYSVRWEGKVTAPVSGTYRFYTQADDGTRLWVNGVSLVNDWTTHSMRERSGQINLEAGKSYDIKLEYFEAYGRSSVALLWSYPNVAKVVIPTKSLTPAQ